MGKGDDRMKRWTKAALAGLVAGTLAVGSIPGYAGTCSPGIDRREYNQQKRIYQGVASGRITPWEFCLLQREQARIRAVEACMKADGHLTKRERARLQHRLNLSSRHIQQATKNRVRR